MVWNRDFFGNLKVLWGVWNKVYLGFEIGKHYPVHLDSGVDVVMHQEEMKCPCDHGIQHWSFMSWAPGVELSKRIEDKEKKFAVQEWQEANPSGSRPISMIISIIKGGTWIQVLMLWCRIKKWNAPVMMMGRCSSRSIMSWAPCVELSKRIEDEKKLQCKNPSKQIHQEANPSENRQESSASSSHRAFGFRCCDAASRRNEMKISSVMMDEM